MNAELEQRPLAILPERLQRQIGQKAIIEGEGLTCCYIDLTEMRWRLRFKVGTIR